MSVFDNAEIRQRLAVAFPLLFVSRQNELIINPKRNTYFRLDGVESERDLKAKILEWLSREAAKSIYRWSQLYHLNGINSFLGTDFSQEEMYEIYTYLGPFYSSRRRYRRWMIPRSSPALCRAAPDGRQPAVRLPITAKTLTGGTRT